MTENIQDVNATTQTAPEAEAEQTPKTFTQEDYDKLFQGFVEGQLSISSFTHVQEDVNRIVANRVSKYSDYEELKAKAAKFDEAEEAQKTELEKAQERANKLQSELDGIKAAEELRKMRDEVSKQTGVPAELLTGTTEEECREQANGIIQFRDQKPGYPAVKDAGDPIITKKGTPKDSFEAWANEALG